MICRDLLLLLIKNETFRYCIPLCVVVVWLWQIISRTISMTLAIKMFLLTKILTDCLEVLEV